MYHLFPRIICLFLICLCVGNVQLISQTNTATFFYYFEGQKISLTEKGNSVLIELKDPMPAASINNITKGFTAAQEVTSRSNDLSSAKVLTLSPLMARDYDNTLEKLKEVKEIKAVHAGFELNGEQIFIGEKVLFETDISSEDRRLREIFTQYDAVLESPIGDSNHFIQIAIVKNYKHAFELSQELYEQGLVNHAAPEIFGKGYSEAIPNDPSFNLQWFLNQGNDADIDAPEAWEVTTGSSSIVVAIFDGNGYELGHPELAGKLVSPYDAVNQTNNPVPENASANHGTPCAGLVGALTNNGQGVASVGNNVSVCPVMMGFNASGGTWFTSSTIIARAANHIISVPNMVAVSNSIYYGSWALSNAVVIDSYANMRTQCRGGKGAVVLASTGNNGGSNLNIAPYIYPGVIGVGATTSTDTRTNFSNFGDSVDVAAPGLGCFTIDRFGPAGYSNTDYTYFSGTSASCPIAAGIVGLMASVDPNLSGPELAALLQQSCDKVGGYSYSNQAGYPHGARSSELGYGRVNAFSAVSAATGNFNCDITGLSIYEGPDCINGAYNICFELSGEGLGGEATDLKVVVDGSEVTNKVTFAGIKEGRTVVCLNGLEGNRGWVDVFIRWTDNCTYTARNLYETPDCGGIDCSGDTDLINLILNGDFENGSFTGWFTEEGENSLGFNLNDGTFNPSGPLGPISPINGNYDVVSSQTGPGYALISQPFFVPPNIEDAILSWKDRIHNWASRFEDPNQEFSVWVLDENLDQVAKVWSTDPGDALIQSGPNSRSVDIASILKAREGELTSIAFRQEDNLSYFNVTLDDIRVDVTGCDVGCNITDIELGNITCSNDGSYYDICFDVEAVNLPDNIPNDLRVVVNGREYEWGDPAFTNGGNTNDGFFVCLRLENDGRRDNDIFISVDEERGCTITARDLWDDPDCDNPGTPPDNGGPCDITDVRLESGPSCDGDGTYGICVRVVGQGLSTNPANLKIVVKGVTVTNNVQSITPNGNDMIVCLGDIAANGAWNVDVFVQWEDGCTYTGRDLFRAPGRDDCNGSSSVSIASGVNIYPNPNQGVLHIESILPQQMKLIITNTVGQTVYKGNIKSFEVKGIDMTRFENGLYIIRMESGKEVVMKKVVLNK